MGAILDRTLKIKGSVGFPTEIYFKMIKLLKNRHYTVKKYKDWLEINPRSNYHQEMMQKKQALEQSVARVMINISDMRRDIELIKHDLRRLEEVKEHFKEKDEHILKSDFVDLVDRNTGPLSLIDLATTGKFPTIVVDFYKIKKEEDIGKLKISQTEKGILKKKWRLYLYWKEKYGKEIDEKVNMLKEQLNSRKASLKLYKELLEPYVKAINKIKFSESEYTGLDDPNLIEGYNTSIAGVELLCWKGVSIETEFEYNKEKYPFYAYIEIDIKRKTRFVSGKESELMEVNMKLYLKTGKEIEEIQKKIKEREELLWKEIEQFKGGEIKEEKETKKEKSKILKSLESTIRAIVGKPIEGDYYLPKGYKGKLENYIRRDFIEFYDDVKDLIGGLKLKRHGEEWR